MNNLPTNFRCFKQTQDDWYPAYLMKNKEKLVEVGFHRITGIKILSFVLVFGERMILDWKRILKIKLAPSNVFMTF